MLANRAATMMIPAQDVERAVAWYTDKLGIEPVRRHEWGADYEFDGVRAFLYPTSFAGTAEHTLLSFASDDLAADMARLRDRGVSFLDYDLPDLKTVDGLVDFGGVKNAWCKDSEGNILGFVEGMS